MIPTPTPRAAGASRGASRRVGPSIALTAGPARSGWFTQTGQVLRRWLIGSWRQAWGPVMSLIQPVIWIVLFGFVGTQLAWTLRPFFGDPGKPFELFRNIEGTFYSDILNTLGSLLG